MGKKGKGRGWHGDSRRHSLARRRISTKKNITKAYGVKRAYDGHYLVSEGVLSDLYEKAKSTVTQSKIGQKLSEVKKSATEPKKVDVSRRGRVGAMQSKIEAEERRVPRPQLTDLPQEALTSPDADSIIAVAENKEKLISYSNELKYDINMLKAERNKLSKQFRTDYNRELKEYNNEKKLAQKVLREQVDAVKSSGLDDDKTKYQVNKLVDDHRKKFADKKIELQSLRERDNVTLGFIKGLESDLGRVQSKINQRVRKMTSRGKVS